ncbi:MAG: MerR family transcriptional regulator [Lacrimispora sp.]|uniref:MerR family transcriptional regulator n=1 Tax=Lacrimispora sp. TaxID=2719234 RepID=UPI0039E36193
MKKYSIGEVSDRIGLSRDTLRFYEKKGIIHPKKEKNGYRTYTYEDILKLLKIRFYRRLDFSIEDIEQILYKSSISSHRTMVREKIKEEKQMAEKHRQALLHLNELQKLYQDVEQSLNCFGLRPLPLSYVMTDSSLINELEISDLCCPYREYRLSKDSAEQTGEYFLFSEDKAAAMKIKQKLSGSPTVYHEKCAYTILELKSPVPGTPELLKAAEWAKSQGHSLLGSAYSGSLLSCAADDEKGESLHYIELYLPVKV